MKVIKYLLVGFVLELYLQNQRLFLGIEFMKCFSLIRFMYGIIMVAILTGIIGIQIMKRRSIKDIKGIAK
jgi:hypothetical protein